MFNCKVHSILFQFYCVAHNYWERKPEYPSASRWQTLSHKVVSKTFVIGGNRRNYNVSSDRHWLHILSCQYNHDHDNLVTICLYAFLSIKIPIHERISNYTQCRLITLINVTHFENKLLVLARTQITLVYFPCYACHYLRSVPRL